ncbi:hypothetical protein CsSME_00032337 [Camellia sinensis var. sinensis]
MKTLVQWADFCKALLVEARWYNKSYTPTLDEYLENGLVSSSGPVLSLLAFFSVMEETTREELVDLLAKSDVLVHCTSMIIRLCNDLGTSAVIILFINIYSKTILMQK